MNSSVRVLIIDNRFTSEMLMSEILSQLDRNLSISAMRSISQFQRKLEKIAADGIPQMIIVAHHLPDQNAMEILPYLKNDPRFQASAIYIVGDYPVEDQEYWKQFGAAGYLQWMERASLLKSTLKNILPRTTAQGE